jgi:hypothetical protein
MSMSRLGMVLAGICLFDLAGTMLGIHFGYVREANPTLHYYFEYWGLLGLVFSKMFLTVIPIFVLEAFIKSRLISAGRMQTLYQTAILGYLVILIGGTVW